MNPRFFVVCSTILLGCIFSDAAGRATSPSAGARFQFREPGAQVYFADTNAAGAGNTKEWLKARVERSSDEVELGSRIVVQFQSADSAARLLRGTRLEVARSLGRGTVILQAPDAVTAARESARLAALPEVLVSSPVMRRPLAAQSAYAYKPNDPLFFKQWHLENRDASGAPGGADLNVRAAWPRSRGDGITIGIADFAVELNHPDLVSRSIGAPHFNFVTGTADLMLSPQDQHATGIAGLAVAERNNHTGLCGVAPEAKFASWRIFNTNSAAVSDEQLFDMFQYRSNTVAVQNHSWNPITTNRQHALPFLQDLAIANAIEFGRDGKGVVMVRSAANYRLGAYSGALLLNLAGNANDDAYASDPRIITVAAVRADGRVAHYSNPGACVLVAAPSSDSFSDGTGVNLNFQTLATTDRTGAAGRNSGGDYAFDSSGFDGTSGAAAQVAGVASLLLSINPSLSYRDVQQVLIHSARHIDAADPGIATNGAGFIVSHNAGFGIPDAGFAVRLAQAWSNRPALTKVTFATEAGATIPDQGFVVAAAGANLPQDLVSIPALMPFEERHPDLVPGEMFRPDAATDALPLVYVGLATSALSEDLTGKAALIRRGGNFYQKLKNVQDAGASFAIVFNTPENGDSLVRMNLTNFLTIPSTFVGNTAGEALVHESQTNSSLRVQLRLNPATYTFVVTNQLLCEHVGVRVQLQHPRRGDLRITLTSPQGTRSILQRYNRYSSDAAPADWTYYSTHHFYESSAGTWTVQITDENAGQTGTCSFVSLTLHGTPINDGDGDGLDDGWEVTHFNSLEFGAADDPDKDGFQNAREQILGTNPNAWDAPFELGFSRWDETLARVNWPSSEAFTYSVQSGADVQQLQSVTNLAGRFPETEFFLSSTNAMQFLRVIAAPRE